MANTQKRANTAGFWADFGQRRIFTHLGLFAFTLLGILLAYIYEPTSQLNDILALGTGYVSLILLVVTLAIGTLNLVLKRKNPVNVNARRDVGIWCGITGVFHGLISFTLYNSGNVLSYFLTQTANGGYSAEFNLNAVSNIVGVLALVIMLVLLLTSNNLSMRYLKGKSWKFVQRFNYPLFILVVVHTIGYLVLNVREGYFTFILTALVIFTILAQLIGVYMTIQREGIQARQATARQTTKTPTLTDDDLAQNLMARRRFLALAGATLIAGVGSSVALSAAIRKEKTTQTTASVGGTSRSTSTAGVATLAPATGATGGPAASATTAPASAGTRIIALSALLTNSATTFTTPDTNETALLIHEQDGSVKAFSNICTHRPYTLTYNSSGQTIYCALHGANFDAKTGAVLNGPPPSPIKSFTVQVDSQGNVVYVSA